MISHFNFIILILLFFFCNSHSLGFCLKIVIIDSRTFWGSFLFFLQFIWLKMTCDLPCWAFHLHDVAKVVANFENRHLCSAYDGAHCYWRFVDASFSHHDLTNCQMIAVEIGPVFETFEQECLHLPHVLIY